jgi:hypothetical protein
MAEYPLPAEGIKNAHFSPEGQPPPRYLPKHRSHGSQHEEQRLRALDPAVAAYVDFALQTPGIQRHRFLRELFALSRQVTPAVFAEALARARRYRVVQMETLHRIAWLCMSQGQEPLPDVEVDESFRQPKLDRKTIMSLYDRFDYMIKQRNIVWLGPTGCGKSGLATGFLLQALDRGYRGYFITFPELLTELYASLADRSEEKALRKYARYDCLVIDEVGYVEIEPAQVGLFFTLMQKRHKTKTTLITSNLGFSEWGSFLKNNHLTGALLDRLTETSHVINMKHCRSLRAKLDESGENDVK